MVDAPEKLWMTAEEMGWPGSFRSFRMSDLEHPEDEYPAYVRADLYDQVKRERDDYKRKWEQACAMGQIQAENAERLAGARVVTDAMVEEAIEAGGFSNSPYTVQHMRYALEAILPALAEPAGEAEPVAWMHTLHMDGNETAVRLARAEIDRPWGKAGIDYDPSFSVTITPLYTTPPDASAIREALERMLKEHDILSGNFGDVMDPKYARPDRWPTAAQKARAALAGAKP